MMKDGRATQHFNIIAVILAFLLSQTKLTRTIAIDNGVNGDPTIDCFQDATRIRFRTYRPLVGRIFVKGRSGDAECVNDRLKAARYNQETIANSIRIPFDACGVARQRTTNPRGVSMETTVVVQFHPTFLTKVDRAYRIVCFYKEAEHTVTSSMHVSMLTTATSLTQSYPMPVCDYTVRLGAFDGPIVRFLRLGDPVYHRWECHHPNGNDGVTPYGMLIHSCFVDDQRGNRIQLVDRHGCSLDPYIMGHLHYSDNLLKVYREAHVFKFADRNQIAFSCQVRLCIRTFGTCDGMTPPRCLPLKNKRSVNSFRNWIQRRLEPPPVAIDTKPKWSAPRLNDILPSLLAPNEDFDLYSNKFTVLDAPMAYDEDAFDPFSLNPNQAIAGSFGASNTSWSRVDQDAISSDAVCLSRNTGGALVLVAFAAIGLLVSMVSLLKLRQTAVSQDWSASKWQAASSTGRLERLSAGSYFAKHSVGYTTDGYRWYPPLSHAQIRRTLALPKSAKRVRFSR